MVDYTKQLPDKRDEFKNVMQQAFEAKYGALEASPSNRSTDKWGNAKSLAVVPKPGRPRNY